MLALLGRCTRATTRATRRSARALVGGAAGLLVGEGTSGLGGQSLLVLLLGLLVLLLGLLVLLLGLLGGLGLRHRGSRRALAGALATACCAHLRLGLRLGLDLRLRGLLGLVVGGLI